MKSFFHRIMAAVFAAAALAANAGGPLGVCYNQAVKYAGAGTVTLNYDRGNLGSRSKTSADTLVTNSVSLWTNVATSTVTLARGTDLPVDVTTSNYAAYIGNNTFQDGLNPVVYDTDGTLTDLLLGPNARFDTLGFAGSAWTNNGSLCQYVEGRAVINGYASVQDTTMTTVLAHEIGHLIGLDHTQIDGVQGLAQSNYPLMYPIAYRSLASLHEDDVAAVTALYPDANVSSTYGTLTGTFVSGAGTPIRGTNIWAQGTPGTFSVVSDYLEHGTGYFKLLLPAGTYTLHAEAIDSSFTGGSSVGPYSEDGTGLSFQSPNYSGGMPMTPVTMTPTITISAGCAASVTFRSTGAGTLGATCATPSAITSPTAGSTLSGSSVTFSWDAGTGAAITERYFSVGTTLGGGQIYSGYQGTALSRSVTGIPTNGGTIYVRLMSYMNGAWQTRDYTYTAATVVTPTASAMTSPVNGSTLAGATVTFTWNAGTSVTARYLRVGSTLGGSQYYGADQGSALSRSVSGLPTNGSTVYVRLTSTVNGAPQSTDYTYTAAFLTAPSAIISPASGSTLSGASVTFQWSAGSGVTERYFSVGTSAGASDIYGGYQGGALSRTVSGIPTNGVTIYVRLASWVNSGWQTSNYTYTAFGSGGVPVTPAKSDLVSPASGSTLSGASVTFGWSAGAGVSERYLAVGTSAGAGNIYGGYQGAALSRTVSGIPTNGSTIYVTLSSWVNGGWQSSTATYTASGSGGTPVTPTKSDLTSPAAGSTLAGASVTFGWSAGTSVTERYLAVGTSAGASNIYGGYQGAALSRTVGGIPTNGSTIYVTLSSWVMGAWQTSTAMYTAASGGSPVPSGPSSEITSPAAGSTLGTSATFSWTAGTAVTERYLMVGTASGGSNIYAGYQGAALSRTVSGLPTGSTTVYVRLMSYIAGSWVANNYTYTSAP